MKTLPVVNVRSLLRAWFGGAAVGALVALFMIVGALDIGESLSFMVAIFIVNCFALLPVLAVLGLLLILIRRSAPGLLARRGAAIALFAVGAGLVQGGTTFGLAGLAPMGHGIGIADLQPVLAAAAAMSGLVMGGLMTMSATAAPRTASPTTEPDRREPL